MYYKFQIITLYYRFQAQTQPTNPFTYIGNGTDPDRNGTEEVLAVEGNVVGMFLKAPDGSVIPINNTEEFIRIEIPNSEERQINVRKFFC